MLAACLAVLFHRVLLQEAVGNDRAGRAAANACSHDAVALRLGTEGVDEEAADGASELRSSSTVAASLFFCLQSLEKWPVFPQFHHHFWEVSCFLLSSDVFPLPAPAPLLLPLEVDWSEVLYQQSRVQWPSLPQIGQGFFGGSFLQPLPSRPV